MKLLVLSDVHGNYDALVAVLRDAPSWDEVIVLGDLVDYGPEPDLVIDELKSMNARIVKGNHDEAVAKGVSCRCGPPTRDVSEYTRHLISLKRLSKGDLEWLARLPTELTIELEGVTIHAFHASARDKLYEYVPPWASDEELLQAVGHPCTGSLVLLGHTHYQFVRVVSGVTVVNPGSVGQPRDGDPRASYAVVELECGRIRVTVRRIEYPVERVVSKLVSMLGSNEYSRKLARILRAGRVV